jgi:hypothetical protein
LLTLHRKIKHPQTGRSLKTYLLYLCPVKREIVIGTKKISAINARGKVETIKGFEF